MSDAFLLQHNVTPWMGLPLWVTADDGGLLSLDLERARGLGLMTRPLAETATQTLHWLASEAGKRCGSPASVGLTPEHEASVLAAWNRCGPGS